MCVIPSFKRTMMNCPGRCAAFCSMCGGIDWSIPLWPYRETRKKQHKTWVKLYFLKWVFSVLDSNSTLDLQYYLLPYNGLPVMVVDMFREPENDDDRETGNIRTMFDLRLHLVFRRTLLPTPTTHYQELKTTFPKMVINIISNYMGKKVLNDLLICSIQELKILWK